MELSGSVARDGAADVAFCGLLRLPLEDAPVRRNAAVAGLAVQAVDQFLLGRGPHLAGQQVQQQQRRQEKRQAKGGTRRHYATIKY